MKRVLNSGFIKLPYVRGSEEEQLSALTDVHTDLTKQQCVEKLAQPDYAWLLHEPKFTFEIKAPQLIFQSFQNAHLGTLTLLNDQNHQTAYLPFQFYKQDALAFIPMDAKTCNDYNTKLNNFYNWSINFYNKLIEGGLCEEQARLMLPQGMFVTFLWVIIAKDLIEFIEKNCNTSPEMYGYCSTLMLYLEEHLPLVTKELKAGRWKNV